MSLVCGEGDSEAVYLVRGSVLSRSFVNHTDETDQRNQINQIPAPRRGVQNVPISFPKKHHFGN